MNSITIHIPAVPVAQPRQRHRIAKKGGKQFVVNYTPGKDPSRDFKAITRMAAHQVFQGPPLEGPLRVDMLFVFPRTKGQQWKRKPMPRIRHAKTPDFDNLIKSTADSLKGLVWIDDAQICDGRIEKWIAAGDEQPHVLLTVTVLDY